MMKRLLMGQMLLVTATAASAEWTVVAGGNNEFTLYLDMATIRRNGNLVKLWDLMDYKTTQEFSNHSFLSTKQQTEYDCKEERGRQLAYSFFSGQMGSGKNVNTNNDTGKWAPIQPGSVGEAKWKIACGKK